MKKDLEQKRKNAQEAREKTKRTQYHRNQQWKVLIKEDLANNVECCNEFQENPRKMVIGSGVENY